MAIYTTKDYGAAKVSKLQKGVGRKLGLVGNATNNQIEGWIEKQLREVAQEQDDIDYPAAKPAPDANF